MEDDGAEADIIKGDRSTYLNKNKRIFKFSFHFSFCLKLQVLFRIDFLWLLNASRVIICSHRFLTRVGLKPRLGQ